MMFNDNSNLIL